MYCTPASLLLIAVLLTTLLLGAAFTRARISLERLANFQPQSVVIEARPVKGEKNKPDPLGIFQKVRRNNIVIFVYKHLVGIPKSPLAQEDVYDSACELILIPEVLVEKISVNLDDAETRPFQ